MAGHVAQWQVTQHNHETQKKIKSRKMGRILTTSGPFFNPSASQVIHLETCVAKELKRRRERAIEKEGERGERVQRLHHLLLLRRLERHPDKRLQLTHTHTRTIHNLAKFVCVKLLLFSAILHGNETLDTLHVEVCLSPYYSHMVMYILYSIPNHNINPFPPQPSERREQMHPPPLWRRRWV